MLVFLEVALYVLVLAAAAPLGWGLYCFLTRDAEPRTLRMARAPSSATPAVRLPASGDFDRVSPPAPRQVSAAAPTSTVNTVAHAASDIGDGPPESFRTLVSAGQTAVEPRR